MKKEKGSLLDTFASFYIVKVQKVEKNQVQEKI